MPHPSPPSLGCLNRFCPRPIALQSCLDRHNVNRPKYFVGGFPHNTRTTASLFLTFTPPPPPSPRARRSCGEFDVVLRRVRCAQTMPLSEQWWVLFPCLSVLLPLLSHGDDISCEFQPSALYFISHRTPLLMCSSVECSSSVVGVQLLFAYLTVFVRIPRFCLQSEGVADTRQLSL